MVNTDQHGPNTTGTYHSNRSVESPVVGAATIATDRTPRHASKRYERVLEQDALLEKIIEHIVKQI